LPLIFSQPIRRFQIDDIFFISPLFRHYTQPSAADITAAPLLFLTITAFRARLRLMPLPPLFIDYTAITLLFAIFNIFIIFIRY
jgi:hypothetical protein